MSKSVDTLRDKARLQGNERRLQEENELLKMEQKALKDQLRGATDKANADIKATAAMTEKKADEVIQKYRAQAQSQGEGLLLIQVLRGS